MNRPTILLASLSATVGIFATGCESMTPGENAAVFGTGAAILGGTVARALGASPGEAFAIGAAAGAVAAATAYIVAKHQATERQRRVAEMRARIYYQHLSEEKRTTMKKKKVRYIAVDTEKNGETSPKAKKAVMIWDTQSQSIVGNNVYDVEKTPSVGSTAKFETHSAQYVGSGG